MDSRASLGTQLSCTQCGGDLHPDEGQVFLTCPYCAATVYVDRSRVVFHYSVAPTLDERQAIAALFRWMSGSQTVKDLDKKAHVDGQMFQYFPLWYLKTKDARGERELLRPAAATSVTELAQLKIPAGDLKPYDPALDAQAVEPTVPLEAALEWLGMGGTAVPSHLAGPDAPAALPPKQQPDIASGFQLPGAERLPEIRLPGLEQAPPPAVPANQAPAPAKPAPQSPAAPPTAAPPVRPAAAQPAVQEAAVVHVPLYFYKYTYNGKTYTAVVDAASGGVLASVYPPKSEAPYQLVGGVAAVVFLCLAVVPLAAGLGDASGTGLLICGGLGAVAAPLLFAWAFWVASKV